MASCHTRAERGVLRAFALRFLVIGLVLVITGATSLGLVALLAGTGFLLAADVSPRGAGAGRGQPG
ncbi:hypothetical protein ABT337_03570 [Saccharopolyspora hirsuta]|uniref:Uncharacterized protein n=1 Tax=Saccharopolyspora hirsuta TaxID=1837 RepID=A0A5M7BJP2_SACHI|nr:hypothetical protein [Saccharopolyspora hirsuta]KAA5828378.1 hypothetical protein F1721_28460 [Saccharopolyspora hirsuta]